MLVITDIFHLVFNNSVLINFGTYTRTNTKDANGIIFVFPCAFSNNCFVIGQAWRNNNSVTDRDVTTDIYQKSLTQITCGWYRGYSGNAYASSFSYIAIGY